MSKMDALRAMREERYEKAMQRAGSGNARRKAPSSPAARPALMAPSESRPADPPPPSEAVGTADETCGHKNMGGRTCTRPRGHAEKSHRYG